MVKDKQIKWIGLYLVVDAVISIYLAGIGNITLTLANFTPETMMQLGQIGRVIRLWIGMLLLGNHKTNRKFIGTYIIIDAVLSIITAREFNSWDDYLRISRAYAGWRILK